MSIPCSKAENCVPHRCTPFETELYPTCTPFTNFCTPFGFSAVGNPEGEGEGEGRFLFRPLVKVCSEHHVFFISIIRNFLFRSSIILYFEHPISFLHGHPVFSIPNFQLFLLRTSSLFHTEWSSERTTTSDVRKEKSRTKRDYPN